jgi:hypothetical protein
MRNIKIRFTVSTLLPQIIHNNAKRMKGTSPSRGGGGEGARQRSAKMVFASSVNRTRKGKSMNKSITVGIDLAKNVFAVYGVDEAGKPALVKPKVAREQLHELIAQRPPCIIWKPAPARTTGRASCARWAGCAADRGQLRHPVPDGGQERQERRHRRRGDLRSRVAAEHALRADQDLRAARRDEPAPRARGFKEERTACINRIRGVLAEFGLVFGKSPKVLRSALADVLEDADNELSGRARLVLLQAFRALARARRAHRVV